MTPRPAGNTCDGPTRQTRMTHYRRPHGRRSPDGLLRVDVAALKSSGQSLMPEGLEKDINPQAMADLIAYLLSLEK